MKAGGPDPGITCVPFRDKITIFYAGRVMVTRYFFELFIFVWIQTKNPQ